MNTNQNAANAHEFRIVRIDEVEAERRARALRAQVMSALIAAGWQRIVARLRRNGTPAAAEGALRA